MPIESVEGAPPAEAGTRQFVTFVAGNEVFAVDMSPVQEIIRLPDVVRVPLAPATLDGLANLRGQVLPIISLRRVFGLAERARDDATRALVINVGQPLGFVVDRVASVVGVEPGQIEDVSAIQSTVDTALLGGVIKDVGGHAMVMVLDFVKLIAREFSQLAAPADGTARLVAALPPAAAAPQDAMTGDELQLVSFRVAEQEYAIAIDDVQEIVQAPQTVIHVPGAAAHVLGVMTLRSRLLPLVDLRAMFGLAPVALDETSRLVVLSLGGAAVGLAVDAVSEVLRVPRQQVDPVPPLLARDDSLADIAAICRLDQGDRLVSIISARALCDSRALKEVLQAMDNASAPAAPAAATDEDEQVVVFRLEREEFGVPIHSIQEIVRVPDELVHVPHAPAFVEGVINLRGTVLPVVDLRLRLGLPRVARAESQRIMVFLIGAVRTGFIVDQVAEVLKIPRSAIEPAPQLSGRPNRLLARMANLQRDSRMVQLLEPGELVDDRELDDLAAVR